MQASPIQMDPRSTRASPSSGSASGWEPRRCVVAVPLLLICRHHSAPLKTLVLETGAASPHVPAQLVSHYTVSLT